MADLTLPLIGLTTLAGYFFAQNARPRQEITQQTRVEEFERPNGSNIYTSNMVEEANTELLNRSLVNYKLAEDPASTGM